MRQNGPFIFKMQIQFKIWGKTDAIHPMWLSSKNFASKNVQKLQSLDEQSW